METSENGKASNSDDETIMETHSNRNESLNSHTDDNIIHRGLLSTCNRYETINEFFVNIFNMKSKLFFLFFLVIIREILFVSVILLVLCFYKSYRSN